MRSILFYFQQLDQYGAPVGVNYRGNRTYKTKVGASLSVLSVLFVLTYFIIKVKKLALKERPSIISNTIFVDMEEQGRFHAKENRFDFGFSFLHIPTWSYVTPDPRIAMVGVRNVKMTIAPQIGFVKEEITYG